MSRIPPTIPNRPALKPAEDFHLLRAQGIGFIEQMGSRLWTDYNTHDPGITILEALCYAITDLAYRTGWDIKDILTPRSPSADPDQPYPNQSFFTAREILTTNPWTSDDYRRLLIDLDGVLNAWVHCKECACDLHYYAWCEEDRLTLSYEKPSNPASNPKSQPQKVAPLGLYEILLELETAPDLGDLNDRKIEHAFSVFDAEDRPHTVTMELRFPEWKLLKRDEWKLFLRSEDAFGRQNGASFNLRLLKFNRHKVDNTPLSDDDLRNNWRQVFYANFEIELLPGGEKISIDNVALRVFWDTVAKNQTSVAGLQALLEDDAPSGFIQRYRRKSLRVEETVARAKAALYRHRNLDEDYCRIKGVEVEEVAVCADVQVTPDADIEEVQARIWFEIEQYFSPPVPLYTLQELMDSGVPVEEIFNGPAVNNGFIKAEDLEAAGLKTVLRASDIINRLMDIEGVAAISNLLLTKYDAEGNLVKGAVDPVWVDGKPVFDPDRTSASWLLFVGELHQPRLYRNLSRFLFYKNGLPFLPRIDEANDTLTQLRGEAERPKIKNAPQDLRIPSGTFRNPEDYFPVQYSFPSSYGIGPDGLPSHASPLRRAQARQMKAYLCVFEQLLGNSFAQLAHTLDLFSLDPAVRRTYFIREFSEDEIQGYSEIVNGLDAAKLAGMAETDAEFHERRNRFLNHLMARFGEQFGEYALLLTNFQGQQVALDRLIEDKISFLKQYPLISRDRGKAFNLKEALCSPDNFAGLKKRISLLLGYPDLAFYWTISGTPPGPYTITGYELKDKNGEKWLEGDLNISDPGEPMAKHRAFRAVIEQMVLPEAYEITPENGRFRLTLKDKSGDPLGRHPKLLTSTAEAQALLDELTGWSSNERAIVVEHLLLRPKFPGDALYPVCTDGPCQTCGDEDPYSFRLTLVMPGWAPPYNTAMEMRRFADRTIRQETPAHLLSKICWIGNDGQFEDAWCKWLDADAAFDWTEERLHDRVEAILDHDLTTIATPANRQVELCKCAAAILTKFGMNFFNWMDANFAAGRDPDDFTQFAPDPVELCPGLTFKPGTASTIEALLKDRYNDYKEVSYRLRVLLNLLGKLRNIYPGATLHDCDDGSDNNPVRLGNTALGN